MYGRDVISAWSCVRIVCVSRCVGEALEGFDVNSFSLFVYFFFWDIDLWAEEGTQVNRVNSCKVRWKALE